MALQPLREARVARLTVVERLAYHKIELSEIEKLDRSYLRDLLPVTGTTPKQK